MTACIIHFGVDLAIRVPVLKSAGVQVDTCSSIDSLIETFEREQVDAVVVPQNPELNLGSVVSITHSRPNIPVIVFPESPSQLDAKFDLVIPVLTPPRQWLADIANLIAQNETLVVESQHLREQASSESSAVKQRLSEQQESATERRKPFPRHGDDLEIWNARIHNTSYEELIAFGTVIISDWAVWSLRSGYR